MSDAGGGRGESGLALPKNHNSTYICEILKTTSSGPKIECVTAHQTRTDDIIYHFDNEYGSMDGAYLEMAAGSGIQAECLPV